MFDETLAAGPQGVRLHRGARALHRALDVGGVLGQVARSCPARSPTMGELDEPEDMFFLRRYEVAEAIYDCVAGWSVGGAAARRGLLAPDRRDPPAASTTRCRAWEAPSPRSAPRRRGQRAVHGDALGHHDPTVVQGWLRAPTDERRQRSLRGSRRVARRRRGAGAGGDARQRAGRGAAGRRAGLPGDVAVVGAGVLPDRGDGVRRRRDHEPHGDRLPRVRHARRRRHRQRGDARAQGQRVRVDGGTGTVTLLDWCGPALDARGPSARAASPRAAARCPRSTRRHGTCAAGAPCAAPPPSAHRRASVSVLMLDIGGVVIPIAVRVDGELPGFPAGPLGGDAEYRARRAGARAGARLLGRRRRGAARASTSARCGATARRSAARSGRARRPRRPGAGGGVHERHGALLRAGLAGPLPGAARASTRSWRRPSLGVLKPDPEAFRAAAAALGERPARCLFVDDLRRTSTARPRGRDARQLFDVARSRGRGGGARARARPHGRGRARLRARSAPDRPRRRGPARRARRRRAVRPRVPEPAMRPEERLAERGLTLPGAAAAGRQLRGWVRAGDLLFLSGQGADG